jgi:hypothetical protein
VGSFSSDFAAETFQVVSHHEGGNTDGRLSQSQFRHSGSGLCASRHGGVLVCDSRNNSVRHIRNDGALFRRPSWLA